MCSTQCLCDVWTSELFPQLIAKDHKRLSICFLKFSTRLSKPFPRAPERRSTGSRHGVRAGFQGADLDRRSAGVGGVPRVHIDIEVLVHENAASMCAPLVPYVAGCVAVVQRPPERRCRSGGCGRGGSDPPLSMPGTASGRVGCARPSTLRREVAPVQQSRAGRPSVTRDGRVPDLAAWAVARAIGGTPALLGDARLPDGRPVGERVIRRLEAALKPPSRVGIDGSGATPRDGGRDVKTHLRPNPHQALGLGGRSPPRPCCPVRHRRPGGDERNSKRPHGIAESGVCASSGVPCVHRPPTSHARSSTAQGVGFSSEACPREPNRPPGVGALHQPPPCLRARFVSATLRFIAACKPPYAIRTGTSP